MAGDDQALTRAAIRRVLDGLDDTRWSVVGRVNDAGTLHLDLSHPLSDYGFSIGAKQLARWEQRVDRFVRDDEELALVRQGPRDVPHGRTVRGLRNAALSHRWPDSTVEQVAMSLVELDLLTLEEAEWIRAAATHDRIHHPLGPSCG